MDAYLCPQHSLYFFLHLAAEPAPLGFHHLCNERISKLKIIPNERLRYMIIPRNNIPNADFKGGYFEFQLRIENTGRRNATVTDYSVEILALRRTFDQLRPVEGKNGVQARGTQIGLTPGRILSKTELIEITPEASTPNGTLLFLIPEVALDDFMQAGLRMHGADRKFDDLQCRLCISDSSGSTASQQFTLTEA